MAGASGRQQWFVAAAVILFFIALSVAMTWPLARTIDSAVFDPSDPYLNTWILDWDYYATITSPRPLFDANAFYPAQDSLALSEHLFGEAMLIAPARMAGVTPLAAHNLLLILGFAACGAAAYLLGSMVTRCRAAGIAAGIAYAFVPWRFTQLTHVQHAWTAGLPLLLAALLAFESQPTIMRAAAFGGALLFVGLTNLHAFAFSIIAVIVSCVVLMIMRSPAMTPRALLKLVAAAAVACALLLPFLLPYRRALAEHHLRGNQQETLGYSAMPHDWLLSNFQNRLYSRLGINDPAIDPERWLFPGAGWIVLTLAAYLFSRERRSPALALAATWIVLGFIGSLGVRLRFYRLLFEHARLFGAIRAPARWAMVTHVGLALAAAVGTAALIRTTRPLRVVIASVICVALLLELRAAPIRYSMSAAPAPAVYSWLATIAPFPILELPIGVGKNEFAYLLNATVHHQRLINGPAPANFDRVRREFAQRSVSPDLADYLKRIGVRYVVIHTDLLDCQADAVKDFVNRSLAMGRMRFIRRFAGGINGDFVFALDGRTAADPTPWRIYVRGQPLPLAGTTIVLDQPVDNQIVGGKLAVMGWAFAQDGVDRVNLRFHDARVVVAATLFDRPDVRRIFPAARGFAALLPKRPPAIPPNTDIQVEIIDGRGVRSRLGSRQFTWF